MSWWGKVLGGTFGFVSAGPLGALLGVVLGHQFDSGLARNHEPETTAPGGVAEAAFFSAVFATMGHVSKADGRVSRSEIGAAELVMARMHLNPAQRQAAVGLFNQGKHEDFPLDAVLSQFRAEVGRQRDLCRVFMEILFMAAYADGEIAGAERALLSRIAALLGITPAELQRIDAQMRPYRAESDQWQESALVRAYATLGVEPDVHVDVIKRAYRRLLSQHHPDKLVSKGLPAEMVALANEKTREINAAYDIIMKTRSG